MKKTLIFLTFPVLCGWLQMPAPVYADSDNAVPAEEHANPVRPEQHYSKKGSRASFDQRLPPVFPGEEVNAGGNKMKVWSSSGPVPVSQAPEPFDRQRAGDLDASQVGVIVDPHHDAR